MTPRSRGSRDREQACSRRLSRHSRQGYDSSDGAWINAWDGEPAAHGLDNHLGARCKVLPGWGAGGGVRGAAARLNMDRSVSSQEAPSSPPLPEAWSAARWSGASRASITASSRCRRPPAHASRSIGSGPLGLPASCASHRKHRSRHPWASQHDYPHVQLSRCGSLTWIAVPRRAVLIGPAATVARVPLKFSSTSQAPANTHPSKRA